MVDKLEKKTVDVYYCGHCEKRPEEMPGVRIVKMNHDTCVMRIAVPILLKTSKAITMMQREKME